MNGAILLAVFVLTATSFSFRYVRWLSAISLKNGSKVVSSALGRNIITLFRRRHFVTWLIGLLVQLDAVLCYMLCETDLLICTIAVIAITAGKIHDVILGEEIEAGLSRSDKTGTIPTVPILVTAMSVALYLYAAGDTCELVTGSAIGILFAGSGVLLMLHTHNIRQPTDVI
jgi:hypothetical protein